jgi:hypothetical protein
MAGTFAADFDEIVETENGFLPGGPSYIITGKSMANYNADIAVCCLARANYDVYRTNPYEILRRLEGKEVHSTPTLDEEWANATCYFIFDLFVAHQEARLVEQEWALVTWFIMEAVHGGNVVVIPIDDDPKNIDLNMYGDLFGDFIEKHFERIDNGKTTGSKRKN